MTEKILHLEIDISAPVQELWRRWTTKEGIQSFFAPGCNIEMKPDGPFEIFFYPENPPGQRGADGQRVMAVEEGKMLSFTWNFPPQLAPIRDQRTIVVLRFEETKNGSKLSLAQMGWGEGELWNQGFEYFKRAWENIVLPRLKYSIERAAIDWSNPPDPETICAALKN
jgi:uncharacterized protein YndB with AHSA1/START domain